MSLTTASTDVFYLTTPEEVELDTLEVVTDVELVEDLNARFEPLSAESLVDRDVTGDDAFGV